MSFRKDQFFKENGVSNIHVSGIELSNYSESELKKLWRDTLMNGMHGICLVCMRMVKSLEIKLPKNK